MSFFQRTLNVGKKQFSRKLKEVRKFFRVGDLQVAPRVYSNQSETVNSMLSAKKVSLGYSKQEDIVKSHFVKFV